MAKKKPVKESSLAKAKKFLVWKRKKGKYIELSSQIFLAIPKMESFVLEFLMAFAAHFTHKDEMDGWFFCQVSMMDDKLDLPANTQYRLVTSLCKRGLIEKKIRGNPGKRYFRINYSKVAKMFKEF